MLIKRSLKRHTAPQNLSLNEFQEMRHKVLILRQAGGVGDILMQRMMFEDFKRVFPESKITYACPQRFMELMDDHPFVDEVTSCDSVKMDEFLICYNISHPCNRYEMRVAPFSDKHRSDIWANHCGVILTNHDMHLNLKDEIKKFGRESVEKHNEEGLPSVMFCPISAMLGKNLSGKQITDTVHGLRDLGLFVYSSHPKPIDELIKLNVPIITDLPLRKWMGVVNAADYVVSVDTAAFHLGGGLKKPLVGIFTFTDGKVYGKYYNFTLVQFHRDNGNWDCGPCYAWTQCPKETHNKRKPCVTKITPQMILDGVSEMLANHPI